MSNPQRTVHIDLQSERVILAIFGPNDTHRRLLERRLKVKLNARATRLSIIGGDEHVDFAQRVLLSLLGMVEQGQTIFLHELERVIAVFESEESPDEALDSSVGEESEFTIRWLRCRLG